jgi:hypothetical protein
MIWSKKLILKIKRSILIPLKREQSINVFLKKLKILKIWTMKVLDKWF